MTNYKKEFKKFQKYITQDKEPFDGFSTFMLKFLYIILTISAIYYGGGVLYILVKTASR